MSNHLIHETSPYLLQHAQNPVDWYPWGEAALEKARKEDKLILVSIGYAACHWCHVMEHESFEDLEVARMMNQHFVCIKVDREERPDIDKIYMDAVMVMTGRGGWPLNCFALPDGRPISGGTYFPKENWIDVLGQLARVYRDDRPKAIEYATNLTQAIQDMGSLTPATAVSPFTQEDIETALKPWLEQIDFDFGGRRSASNKFPLPANNLFLLRSGWLMGKHNEGFEPQKSQKEQKKNPGTFDSFAPFVVQKTQNAASITLEKMAFGGIYDHLGGGFARYSVDPYWKVPHFEKMLYDNSQLVSLYAEAWQATDPEEVVTRDLYKHVVYQTLAYTAREMTSPEGGFFASLDADSEGVEGKFYTWKYEELEAVLGEDISLFADYYNCHRHGNWEHTNVLYVLESEEAFAKQNDLDSDTFKAQMADCREKLFKAREPRIRPGLDDKILTSWNALMLKGYVDAYRVFGEPSFLAAAIRNGNFIAEKLADGGKLYRNFKEGKRTINGFLDDYGFLIDAYISLYQVTFDEKWLTRAESHLKHVDTHFYDSATGMYYYTSDQDPKLVKRHIEVQDDVTPASNSTLAHALHTLGLLLHNTSYMGRSREMLQTVKEAALANPAWHANWCLLLLRHAFPHYEVAIAGPDPLDLRMAFEKHYYPNRIYAGAASPSELPILVDRHAETTTIYVCEESACQLPVGTVAEAVGLMG